MQKIKSINFSLILQGLKHALIGVVITLICTVVFALVLKFVDVPSVAVSYINDIIKAVSILVMVILIRKANDSNILLKSIGVTLLYSVLSLILFAIMNGGLKFGSSILFDLLFNLIAGIIIAIIVNITKKKA
ncbi:MAG: hypothetical protein ACI4L6_02060 [Candidatus Onthoplasma sp.]